MNVATVQNDFLSAALVDARGGGALVASRQADSGGNETFRAIMSQSFDAMAKPHAAEVDIAARDDAMELKAREAAAQLVATAFLMPIMESMHQSPFAAEPFAPSSAEKRFTPMLDWQFADRIANAQRFPLVDAVVERIMKHVADVEGARPDAASVEATAKGSLNVRG